MDFNLSEDQRAIVDMAERFTADEITPHAAAWDKDHIFPRDTIEKAAELGFGSIYVSEESGGIGLGRVEAALIWKRWPMVAHRHRLLFLSTIWARG